MVKNIARILRKIGAIDARSTKRCDKKQRPTNKILRSIESQKKYFVLHV